MLMLSIKEQRFIDELDIINLKKWLHIWLDGLHKGTHPAWSLSPVNILSLGKLWFVFQKEDGGADFGKYQRIAIKNIAITRCSKNDHISTLPNINASDQIWSDYFNTELIQIKNIKNDIIEWHKHNILSNEDIDMQLIRSNAQCLSSILTLQGFSERELFLRVNSGVFDLLNLQGKPIKERFLEFMDYLSSPTVKLFICWTKININREISNTTLNRITKIKVKSPLDIERENPSVIIIEGDRNSLYIASKHLNSHSSSAFIQHRRQSAMLLNKLSSQLRLQLDLNNKTNVIDSLKEPNRPWVYDIESIMEWKRMKFTSDSILIPSASKYYHDYPELVIKDFCDNIENSIGPQWVDKLTNSYVTNLRKQLTFNLRVYVKRARKTWEEPDLNIPTWLMDIGIDCKKEYKLSEILNSSNKKNRKNDLFISRVYQVTDGWNQAIADQTQGEYIKFVLTISKGIRNIMTHNKKALDNDLNEILWHFLNTLIYACNNERAEID